VSEKGKSFESAKQKVKRAVIQAGLQKFLVSLLFQKSCSKHGCVEKVQGLWRLPGAAVKKMAGLAFQVQLVITVLLLLLRGLHLRPVDETTEEDYDAYSIGHPQKLEAIGSTQTSISLQWEIDIDPEFVDSYRIYYRHQNFEDVKTVKEPQPSHILKGLEPYTQYEIWVASIVNGTSGLDSEHIFATTDVEEPSAPEITNVTCYDTGMLYVGWTRPLRY
jgi:hypothetical protein